METLMKTRGEAQLEEKTLSYDLETFTGRMEAMVDGLCAAGKVPLIEGDIGFGKTSFFRAYAKKQNRPLYIFNVALRPREDMVGHPRAVDRYAPDGSMVTVTVYTMTEWFYNIVHKEPNAIILFDEFKNADPEQQAGLLNILQDHEVDGVSLPKTVSMIALCNPTDISANGWELSAPAANRFCHIKWNFPPKEMVELMQVNFGQEIPDSENTVRIDVTTFLLQNLHRLHEMPKDTDDQAYGWPSPRTWDNAIQVMANLPDVETLRAEILRGFVGPAASADYFSWMETTRVPDVNAILVDGMEYPWEDEQAADHATVIRFMYSVLGLVRSDETHWQAACDFIVKAVAHDYQPQAAAIVTPLLKNHPAGSKFPVEMVSAFGEIFDRLKING